jgi:glycosyltransferase involved in cell wall biosynthesis
MTPPWVSIICLCYNHEKFVQEAIESVLHQTYPNIELIVVDDGSTDNSADVISKLVSNYPSVSFLRLEKNIGYCKTFNRALAQTRGDFIIDLAADDILLPERVAEGVNVFQQLGDEYGLNFTDAEIVNEEGKHLRFHSDRFPHDSIPQGDCYASLINRYFICSPTMMFSRKLIDALHGYDESLAYEDFDLWIRGSRLFKFHYTPKVLVKKRSVPNSMSKNQFTRKDKQRQSTFAVCQKILELNKTQAEQRALSERITYEIKQSLKLLDFRLALKYLALRNRNQSLSYSA